MGSSLQPKIFKAIVLWTFRSVGDGANIILKLHVALEAVKFVILYPIRIDL